MEKNEKRITIIILVLILLIVLSTINFTTQHGITTKIANIEITIHAGGYNNTIGIPCAYISPSKKPEAILTKKQNVRFLSNMKQFLLVSNPELSFTTKLNLLNRLI
jgi:hypothetical protein